jgi:hypothetical protein
MLERLGMVLHWLGIILAGLWVLGVGWESNWSEPSGELFLLVFGPALGLYRNRTPDTALQSHPNMPTMSTWN